MQLNDDGGRGRTIVKKLLFVRKVQAAMKSALFSLGTLLGELLASPSQPSTALQR